jgi:hypothetical protein|nr:MAG TPA: hypothetical protein [Caudoviricetes sp.]
MDLVRKRIDEEFADSECFVTKHIICDLELKVVRVKCTADEIYTNGEYYWSLDYIVNGYAETTYNEYVEFMYRQAVETAKRMEKFSGVKINIWRY